MIRRARRLLESFEWQSAQNQTNTTQLPLFDAPAEMQIDESPAEPNTIHPAIEQLNEINPDELTPRAALDALYQLKALLDDQNLT